MIDEIMQSVPSESEIAERLAPYGDTDRGLRASKPDDNGLIQYIWRMARFHSGEDMHMPVTARGWLKDWLENNGYIPEYSHGNGSASERGEITNDVQNELEEVVSNVLREEFGMSDLEAAKRWSKAGLF